MYVELNKSYMILNNIEFTVVKDILKDELIKLNKKLPEYSKVFKIIISPKPFVRKCGELLIINNIAEKK